MVLVSLKPLSWNVEHSFRLAVPLDVKSVRRCDVECINKTLAAVFGRSLNYTSETKFFCQTGSFSVVDLPEVSSQVKLVADQDNVPCTVLRRVVDEALDLFRNALE